MSVQFGRWNLEGRAPAPDYIERVNATLTPYGPDSNESYANDGLRILYRAFHTTKESHLEKQPCISPSGVVITWDGRLDNRTELINDLRDSLTVNSTDVAIVAAAYEKWGERCLGKLIGDWALSLWNPRERSVLLAKDPIGTKHLYYSFDDKHIAWSTILDPLVLFAGRTFEICEEYIAGWFSYFPATHLTPYVGIQAVPPSCSVLLQPNERGQHGVKHLVSKYWDFDPGERIRYRTDAEYEEHFRSALITAVHRCLRSDRPILAGLSGGIDSSSIVCIADLLLARGQAECPRLDTITWYDESEPNWGELPHFTKVEEKRGRSGHHINAGAIKEDQSPLPFGAEFLNNRFAVTPIPNSRPPELFQQHAAYVESQGYRVTLCGIGGGETTGDGVPTPTPEFQNLLARARFVTLARQLNAWAAKTRKARLPLLWEALRGFVFPDIPEYTNPLPSWFQHGFLCDNRAALCGYPSRVKFLGPLPSFQHNIRNLDAYRKLFERSSLQSEPLGEMRFPYFDRDLLEFMYAAPREQVVGVGRRRFLMKRALVGIVPDEILNRKKKEIVSHETPKGILTEWPSLEEIGCKIIASDLGIIDSDRFLQALQKMRRSKEIPLDTLKRTLTMESWLRHLTTKQVIKDRGQLRVVQDIRVPSAHASEQV